MKVAYLNKKFIPLDKAKVSVLDRGFLYGDGIFETMRSHGGVVFLLEKHLERLYGSLKRLNLALKIKKQEIEDVIYKLLNKNNLKNAYIKVIVTRGKASSLLIPSGNIKSTIAIYTLPYKGPPKSIYNKGLKIGISESRLNTHSRAAGNKTLNYLENILCRFEANRKGFDDMLLLNTDGFISEATTSNIFFIKQKILFTPSLNSGALPGIMRSEVIRISRKLLRYKVKEASVKKRLLKDAEEAFITNSLIGVVPVRRIGDKRTGDGRPGPVTKEIMRALKCSIDDYCRRKA